MDGGLKILWTISILALLLIGLGTGTAMAGVPQGAAEAMDEGARLYQEQDYAGAAVAFRRAYEIHGDARFLYNAARASHHGENLEQAYQYYVGALEAEELSLDTETAASARAYKRALEVQWNAEERGEQWREQSPEVAELEEVRWGRTGSSGAGIGAMGGLLLGLSGALAWRTSSAMGTLESGEVASLDEYNREVEVIERNQRWGQRTLYGGGALLAIGAGLVVWELATVDESSTGMARIEVDGSSLRAIWEVRFE